ncbi:hypothetical protein [Thalassobacillus devorans]|uniref:hypothetical protein n=1 Tax=Thalassobacillus devorans TaxID=279813 RepID=UPI0004916AB5|nr:hypothetical protein [Thalassobacillus devorans]
MPDNEKKQHPFDAFMFGNRTRTRDTTTSEKQEESNSFDWMELMKNMSDTYHAFNPYIKNLSKAIDKFKSGSDK